MGPMGTGPVLEPPTQPATGPDAVSGSETVTGTDGRRYWLPPVGSDDPAPAGPSRSRTSLNWLLGAGVLVLVTLVAGVFLLGHALDGISTSAPARVVDDYAAALARNDSGAASALACPVDRSEVASTTADLLAGRPVSSAQRRGGLHRDSGDTEHATVRIRRAGAADVDVTVAVAEVARTWCVVSATPPD